ncbi:hypothetical protein AAAC51_10885 [Priestia megaterium]
MLDNYELFLFHREVKGLIADYNKCKDLAIKNELYHQIILLKKRLNINEIRSRDNIGDLFIEENDLSLKSNCFSLFYK